MWLISNFGRPFQITIKELLGIVSCFAILSWAHIQGNSNSPTCWLCSGFAFCFLRLFPIAVKASLLCYGICCFASVIFLVIVARDIIAFQWESPISRWRWKNWTLAASVFLFVPSAVFLSDIVFLAGFSHRIRLRMAFEFFLFIPLWIFFALTVGAHLSSIP